MLDAQEVLDKAGWLAAQLFAKTKYTGSDGEIFWQAAAIVAVQHKAITEADLFEAAESAKRYAVANKAGYFFRCLQKSCAKRKLSLELLLRTAQLPPEFHCGPPTNIYEPPQADQQNNIADPFLCKSTTAAG